MILNIVNNGSRDFLSATRRLAKMSLPLQLWIIENYTSEGEVILDPMAGSGTILVACSMGRDVIAVELEQKFVDMMGKNWEKIRQRGSQLGCSMGRCQIIQGDARNLEGILADKIITSPPYAEQPETSRTNHGILNHPDDCRCNFCRKNRGNKGMLQGYRRVDKIITSPPYAEVNQMPRDNPDPTADKNARANIGKAYSDNPVNIGNLYYGEIDKIITSPPYEEAMGEKHHSPRADKLAEEKSNPVTYTDRVDSIITSPPYENAITGKEAGIDWSKGTRGKAEGNKPRNRSKEPAFGHLAGFGMPLGYSEAPENIGNLKSDTYLEAMLSVYKNCFAVLKSGGLIILVVKNFIRNKQIIRLDLDTIKLCEQGGFTFKERHYRKLPSQSFWRVIYHKKFPDVEQITSEDVLVFEKAS